MDVFDKIFSKSDIDESKKKSKMILGKLLIKLRTTSHMKLYSLLGDVSDTDIRDGKMCIEIDDQISYDTMNNARDIAVLDGLLSEIESGLKVELSTTGRQEFDKNKFIDYLKKEFGKIVTIK